MSLIKQLWIGIIIMLMLALGGSFSISLLSAKQYLEEQLRVKNMDNATSLALSISQMDKDIVSLELLISAQFDTGHYEFITLTDPQKHTLISRRFEEDKTNLGSTDVPLWFMHLIDFDAAPGIAQIQNGWQQFGTLTVKSHSRFAWQALWKSSIQLLTWFVVAAIISGLVGTFILKFISSPLDTVIKQAESIGQRRFITSDEPRTTEFQRLVRAMNTLSKSVKAMLEKETKQLEKLRRESQLDALTELPNRSHFLNLLESKINRDDTDSSGAVGIIRLLNLSEINNQQGRAAADYALMQIAAVLHQFCGRYEGSHAGRLNGSDFMVVIPNNPSAESIGSELTEQLNSQLSMSDLSDIQLPVAICSYEAGEKRNELLHKLDGALSQAELKGNRALVVLNNHQPLVHRNLNEWRETLNGALNKDLLQLASFPVKDSSGALMHEESPVRIKLDGDWRQAGYFMPWAARLGILPAIDKAVLQAALHKIDGSSSIAINISADSLCSASFREQALQTINANLEKAEKLWIEFPESCALRHMAELRSFTNSLRNLGCFVGLEHVGLEFTKINELQDVGLHYLKIDAAIIRDIHSNTGNQQFLSGLCKIGHSLGMLLVAEGVVSTDEKVKLIELDIDGMTGPGV